MASVTFGIKYNVYKVNKVETRGKSFLGILQIKLLVSTNATSFYTRSGVTNADE